MSLLTTIVGFVFFVALFLGVGALAAARSTRTSEDYLTGGRSFGTWLVGLSLFAAGNSGFMMLGAVGAGYTQGLRALWLPLAYFLGELTYWAFFPPRINALAHERRSLTVPGFLAAAAEPDARLRVQRVAGVLLLVFTGIYLSAQLQAAAKVVDALVPVGDLAAAAVAAVAVLGYSSFGGLRASVWTNATQGVLMLALCVSMLGYVLVRAGGPAAAASALAVATPTLLDPFAGGGSLAVLLYVLGFTVTGFGYSLGQPQLLVRVMAGRSPAEVRRARWIYLVSTYVLWSFMTVLGLLLNVATPGLADPEQGLIVFATRELSPFAVGLVLAGVFAAIASTADSQLLVCSSAAANDLAPAGATGSRRRQVVASVAVGVAAFALVAADTGHGVFATVLFVNAALAGGIAPVMLVVTLRWRTSGAALVAAMLAGVSVTLGWALAGLGAAINEALPGFAAALLAHRAFVSAWPQRFGPARGSSTP